MELARPFIDYANLRDAEPIGQGIEFVVFRATSQEHGPVVLKVPRYKVYQNVNDPNTEAKDLIRQELAIYNLLHGGPVPVPKPYRFLEIDGYPAMMCEYVEDDESGIAPEELGRIAALIHSTKPPENLQLVALEGKDALTTLVQRVIRRFTELVREEPSAASWAPKEEILKPIAQSLRRFPSCLLHMDLRDVNLRMRQGRVAAVFDWTNAMVGPAVIDVFRILELGQPGDAFIEAYTEIAPLSKLTPREETFLRLDAALMLALVFISEAPDPERRVAIVKRVGELARALQD